MEHKPIKYLIVTLIVMGLLFTSCTIKKHEDRGKSDNSGLEIYFGNTGFDANLYVREIWDNQVIPCIAGRAVTFDTLLSEMKADEASASKKYGYRVGEEGTLFNFAVKGRVKIDSINQESRNGLLYASIVSPTFSEQVVFQIGPVYKGTSIRDILDFISLNDFENQVEFARLANELNFMVRDDVLASLDFSKLIGTEADVLAVFTRNPKEATMVMTPVQFNLICDSEDQL